MKQKYITLYILSCLSFHQCLAQTKKDSIKLKIDKLLEPEIESSGPGGSVLLKKGRDIIYLKNYGLANLETKEKITEHTSFNTGSISKTFVSNGILILKERGLLSLEDSLSMYFNDFSNKEIANKVQIKHLLSHTSGLPDNRKIKENVEFYLTAKDSENFASLKLANNLEFQSGEKYKYSNPAFNGLVDAPVKVSHLRRMKVSRVNEVLKIDSFVC